MLRSFRDIKKTTLSSFSSPLIIGYRYYSENRNILEKIKKVVY